MLYTQGYREPRQARLKVNAERLGLNAVTEQDGNVLYLMISKPSRPYAEKITMGASINPHTGRETHFALVDGKRAPLNRAFIVLTGMVD